jgi:hypothetical protein
VISYLLHAEHSVSIPDGRPSARLITDWLEQTVPSTSVRVERVGETLLKFGSSFWTMDPDPSNKSLKFVANGEIEVEESAGGFRLIVRANPHIWLWLLPVVQLVGLAGWNETAAVLRWGAGLGGIILGGFLFFLAWSGLNSFLDSYVGLYRRACARRLWNDLLARMDAALGAYLDERLSYEETKTALTLLWRELLVGFTGPEVPLPLSEVVIPADRFTNLVGGRSSDQIKKGGEVLQVAMLAAQGQIGGRRRLTSA